MQCGAGGLQGVIGEVLAAVGEHDAVDLGLGPGADQRHVLIDLGQAASQGADGPLQRGVAAEQGLLMGEMPHAHAPVLQIDVLQPGFRPQQQFDGPAVQPGSADASTLAVSASSVASAPSSSTTRQRSSRRRRRRSGGKDVKGPIHGHPRGNVEQSCRRTSRPLAGRRTCRSRAGWPPPPAGAAGAVPPCSISIWSRLPKSTPRSAHLPSSGIDRRPPLSNDTAPPASSTPSVEQGRGAGARRAERGNPELLG